MWLLPFLACFENRNLRSRSWNKNSVSKVTTEGKRRKLFVFECFVISETEYVYNLWYRNIAVIFTVDAFKYTILYHEVTISIILVYWKHFREIYFSMQYLCSNSSDEYLLAFCAVLHYGLFSYSKSTSISE